MSAGELPFCGGSGSSNMAPSAAGPQGFAGSTQTVTMPGTVGVTGSGVTLFVEGLPPDATIREVSHIFRQYDGFRNIRLITKADPITWNKYYLCFVEYEDFECASVVMKKLQGYVMDLDHPERYTLTISLAKQSLAYFRQIQQQQQQQQQYSFVSTQGFVNNLSSSSNNSNSSSNSINSQMNNNNMIIQNKISLTNLNSSFNINTPSSSPSLQSSLQNSSSPRTPNGSGGSSTLARLSVSGGLIGLSSLYSAGGSNSNNGSSSSSNNNNNNCGGGDKISIMTSSSTDSSSSAASSTSFTSLL